MFGPWFGYQGAPISVHNNILPFPPLGAQPRPEQSHNRAGAHARRPLNPESHPHSHLNPSLHTLIKSVLFLSHLFFTSSQVYNRELNEATEELARSVTHAPSALCTHSIQLLHYTSTPQSLHAHPHSRLNHFQVYNRELNESTEELARTRDDLDNHEAKLRDEIRVVEEVGHAS